jgi:hypothetical protein
LIFYRWEYYFEWGGYDPPWISAIANGMGLEMLAYAYNFTKNSTYLELGNYTLNSFLIPWYEIGVLDEDEHGYWYLEYAYTNKMRVLNGFLRSLVGLYKYYQISANITSLELFQQGSIEAIYHLPDYDTGNWSAYSLENNDAPIHYHVFHIQLLRALFTFTSEDVYLEFADRWQFYLDEFSSEHDP